jgi:transcriptional regulator with XRE-family HTH domain
MSVDKSSKEARAKRVRVLRQMTGLSRQELAEKYNLSFGNFQNWEGPRYGGLTEKGAQKILASCAAEGVTATLEWLMHGVEPGPKITETFYTGESNLSTSLSENIVTSSQEIALIDRELALFKENYRNQALHLLVEDDGMEPLFEVGEIVAGQRFSAKDFPRQKAINCIVELTNGKLLVRNLKLGSNEGLFLLSCLNPNTKVNPPLLYDVPIVSFAPILWRRRKSEELK